MVKYWLTYKGIEGDTYLLEILDSNFEGQKTEIHGYVEHNYASRKDLMQSIISSSLDITLEADEDLTLQDLYTEEESKFKIRLKRNDQTIFYGILKPDGIWEDFVSNRWEISMDAMDGLSIIKELSFVKDDGTFYIGKITQFDAVKQCLKRIGYELPVNISADLPVYDGFTGSDSILKSVKMNADRFYQDAQKNNIMDCEAVLKSVLEPYNATVIQMNGEWWIYRPIDVKNQMNFYRYDGANKTDIIWNAGLEIGSHIDKFEIFHANANQKKSINPSTQAFRVNYKYGTVKSIAINPNIEISSGLTSEGWIINQSSSTGFSPMPNNRGFFINKKVEPPFYLELIRSNQNIELIKDDIIDVIFKFSNKDLKLLYPFFRLSLGISFQFITNNFILNQDGWVDIIGNESAKILKTYSRSNINITQTFNLPPFPEDGDLEIIVYVDYLRNGAFDPFIPPPPVLEFYSIDVIPNSNSNYKGEFHTAQRSTRISSVTKNDKTVSVGDSVSDIYLGTLYKENEDPTEFWRREGITETKSLLRIMVEDTLRISPRPMYLFEGDIYGYFPYLANVLINNVPGKYQVSKYSFDTKKNINRTNFKEFDNASLIQDTDFRYEFEYDYGNETRVTIKS